MAADILGNIGVAYASFAFDEASVDKAVADLEKKIQAAVKNATKGLDIDLKIDENTISKRLEVAVQNAAKKMATVGLPVQTKVAEVAKPATQSVNVQPAVETAKKIAVETAKGNQELGEQLSLFDKISVSSSNASEKQVEGLKKVSDEMADVKAQEDAMWEWWKNEGQINRAYADREAAIAKEEAAIERATQKEIADWNKAEDAAEAAIEKRLSLANKESIKQDDAQWNEFRKYQSDINRAYADREAAIAKEEAAIEEATRKEIAAWNAAEDAHDAALNKQMGQAHAKVSKDREKAYNDEIKALIKLHKEYYAYYDEATNKDNPKWGKTEDGFSRQTASNRMVDINDKIRESVERITEAYGRTEDQINDDVNAVYNLERAQAKADRRQSKLDAQWTNDESAVNKVILKVEEYREKLRQAGADKKLLNQFDDIIKRGKDFLKSPIENLGKGSAKAKELNRDFLGLEASAKASGAEVETLGHKITRVFKEKFGYAVMAALANEARKAIRMIYTNVVDLDTAMTELRKVTDETAGTYKRFLDESAESARKLGVSMTDLVNATADFARLGYNISDASNLAQVATVYKHVGDGISDISEASESIISTMRAFGIEASNAIEIIDKFNEVGNTAPISAAGIGEALIRSASALHVAGNSLDESIALITAANSVTQDVDKVGTSLKTISMYLRAAKTEAEEAGESTEGMADSVSELRKEIKILTNNRVDIMADADGTQFKSTYQILKEISEVWGDLQDVTKANLLERLSGEHNLLPGRTVMCA